MNTGKPIEILLIEDDVRDALLIQDAFRKSEMPVNLQVALDGETALDLLRGSMKRINIILLDLSLPRKNGKEILKEIKNDPALKTIPVIVLSGSKKEADVTDCYDLHANSYIVKPLSQEKLNDAVTTVRNFWFGVVALPDSAGQRKAN